jgi:transcriptional regulator
MYLPPAFEEVDEQFIVELIAAHPLAQLVTMTDAGLMAGLLPMLYQEGSLVGHLARANPQWSRSRVEVEALVIFTGPDGYVSPNWYPSKRDHGRVVPTWNYEVVQARGTLVIHDDPEWKLALVTRLTEAHEAPLATPWAVADAPADYLEAMVGAIVGIEVRPSSIVAKRKLSQNRSRDDVHGVISGLAGRGTPGAEALAEAMRDI